MVVLPARSDMLLRHPCAQAYPEFCRMVTDKAPPALGQAMGALESAHGRVSKGCNGGSHG